MQFNLWHVIYFFRQNIPTICHIQSRKKYIHLHYTFLSYLWSYVIEFPTLNHQLTNWMLIIWILNPFFLHKNISSVWLLIWTKVSDKTSMAATWDFIKSKESRTGRNLHMQRVGKRNIKPPKSPEILFVSKTQQCSTIVTT